MDEISAWDAQVVYGTAVGPELTGALGRRPERVLRHTLTLARRGAQGSAPLPLPGPGAPIAEGIHVRTKRTRAMPAAQDRVLTAAAGVEQPVFDLGDASWR
jgi:hypothetical protein